MLPHSAAYSRGGTSVYGRTRSRSSSLLGRRDENINTAKVQLFLTEQMDFMEKRKHGSVMLGHIYPV